ncbi:MAG: hypothetical protein K6F95_06905 [Selenomonas sp.]|uniref:hypothetical protein n=1 Tax=Selenomonas sp. TaxID=2053611 RepID=UPI0025E9BC2F|nr:hypothetical protein [Selenomonas sp.]MCR5757619.1 hypothetical protein [Selenomonas sp.]
MEASMNVGIRPIERPQASGAGEGVGRRGDGGGSSAAFSPKTNVAIQNAVDDMAGILSKIASNQTDAVEKMPVDLQKLIQNVMKQAFSLEETLAQGLGSTLESQRFSMEQLSAFSRMLTQMGKMMDRGMNLEVSDTMQVLLTNLKTLVNTDQGASLEPVLLTKAAFELLDNKPLAELPKEIQQLLLTLQPQGIVQPLATGESNSLQFLQQLVQYFMPRPAGGGENGAVVSSQQMMQNGQALAGGNVQTAAGQNMASQNMTGPVGSGAMQANAGQAGEAMPQTIPSGAGQQVQSGQQVMQNGQTLAGGNVQTAAGQNMASQNMTGPVGSGAMQANAGQAGGAMPQTVSNGAGQQAQSGQQVMQNGQTLAGGNVQTAASQNMTGPVGSSAMQANAGQAGEAMPQTVSSGAGQQVQSGQQMMQNGQTLTGGNVQTAASQNMASQNMASQNMAGQAGTGTMQANAGQTGEAMPQTVSHGAGQQAQSGQQMVQNGQSMFAGKGQVSSTEMGQQARPQQAAMQQAKNELMNQMLENTPQTMNALRDLAQLLLEDGNLTQKDALLMKSFVNGKEALLSAKEAQQLQQLIRLCQANVPATIQQAALQQNIPDLPRLWAFMQLCDMAYTRNMTSRQLKKAGKDVAAFVLSMRGSMEGDNSIVPGQRSLNFMMPMYMGEESTYPAYIHVYDEKQPDPETGEMKKETWLRLCVLTDNIGAVELTCRVYQENQLDMRLFFSSTETANEFRAEADALRGSLQDSKLKLKDLKIGAVGERRFM